MPKILVIRFSSIGDIVLTTPVVRALKKQVPNAEVHYCTKKSFGSILTSNPYIDKVHLLDGKLSALAETLKSEKFDYVVDLHSNLRTTILKWKIGVPSKSFDKLNLKKWLLVNLKVNRMPDKHIVTRYMEAASNFGVKEDTEGLDFFIPEGEEVAKEFLPSSYEAGFVSFAIGAQHATKRLPTDKIIEFCRKVSLPIVFLGGKEDVQVGEKLEQLLRLEGKEVFNACGKCSLNESASILKQSSVVVSHDTGLMHIAAAFKKEIYSIWGNTTPAFGMYPYKTVFKAFENTSLSCRPCSKIGYKECPKGHFKCMVDQDFSGVSIGK